MNKRWLVIVVVALAVSLGSIVARAVASEKEISLKEAPAKVRATIEKHAEGAKIQKVEVVTEKGKKVYDVEIKRDGKTTEFSVSPEGKYLGVKTDEDEGKPEKKEAKQEKKAKEDIKLSAAAAKTFKKEFPKGKMTKLDVDVENGVTVYDIEFTDGATEKETDITADGTMLEFTVVIDAKAVPKAAMKAIQKAAEGATMKRIEDITISYDTKDGKVIKLKKPITHYAVELAKGEQTAEIVVNPDGTVVEAAKWSGKPEKKDAKGGKIDGFTAKFDFDKANLTNVGKNPYFIPLEPGYRLILEGDGAKLTVTVTHKTKLVDGVETRVVEEREEKDGQPIEIAQNYFAIDKTTNAVYYFGEDVDMYKNGKVVNHEGSWLSGVAGAKFGMMMPGKPKVGDKFQQEVAPKVAMDRCEIVAIGEKIKTPADIYKNCLCTKDGSALESGSSTKVYAPGVGLVKDDEFLLVRITKTVLKKKSQKGEKAPEAVQTTVKELVGDGKLLKLALEADGNYELDYQVNGVHRAAIISKAGKIQEQEITVEASTLPKAVTQAVKKLYPKGKITLAEKSTTKEGVVYELRVTVDKKSHSITVSPEGKVQ